MTPDLWGLRFPLEGCAPCPDLIGKEFRDDVVAIARRADAPVSQIAKDFGISDSCRRNWLHAADVEDGNRPGVRASESAELRELRRVTGCVAHSDRGSQLRSRKLLRELHRHGLVGSMGQVA